MRWIWIDRVTALEKGQRCRAVKNVTLAEDHLHDHFPRRPVMPATLLIEGMAQTAGILVGHARDFQEKVILAKIARAGFARDIFPGETVRYDATLERLDDNGASARGEIRSGVPGSGREDAVGTVELTFSHLDRNPPPGELPDHNFVFTEPLMDLLRHSGVL